MAGIIRIARAGFGVELHRAPLKVKLDGFTVATLTERGDAFEFDVNPGPHKLQVTCGRFRSRVLELDVFDGGEMNFRTHGAVLWPRYVASLIKPEWAINLHRY